MQLNTEKVKFGLGVTSMIAVYLLPQIGGFYFFVRAYL
jgi:hypothetical protein